MDMGMDMGMDTQFHKVLGAVMGWVGILIPIPNTQFFWV
jgi:hypothetical protein